MAQAKRRTKAPVIAPAVAAQRAAVIFGAPGSLFTGHSKVSAKGLQRGLSEMVARVWGTVPNVRSCSARGSQLRLTYIGETAQCNYAWDSRAPLSASAVINLPVIGDDDNMIPRSIADQYTAYALHELGHVLFTPLPAFRAAIYDLSSRYSADQDFVKGIVNALEDVDIERNIIAHGYAPGAATMLGALLAKCVADIPRKAYGTMEVFSVTLAFGLRGYAPNARALVEALPAPLRTIYDMAATEMHALPLRRVGDYDSMAGVVSVADKVIAALCALRDAQPQPGEGEPGEGEPGEGEPGEGEPGEGEPGEGEPGEGEPGEGEPGEGEPGEGEPGEGEPGEGEPGEGEPGEGEPGEGEPGEGEPGEGEPGEGEPGEGEPGAKPAPDVDAEALVKTVLEALRGAVAQLSADMQPETAGDPADGASGIGNANVRINIMADVGQASGDAMQVIATRTLGKAPKVAQALRQLLDASAYDSKEGGRRSGSLRTGALHRVATGADTVFERRSYRDGSDSAVTLLIDQSSSMNVGGNYSAEQAPVHHARNLAAALARLLSQSAGTSFECLGFTSTGGFRAADGGALSEWTREILANNASGDDQQVDRAVTHTRCTVNVFKAFKDAPAVAMRSLKPCSGSGGTPDAAAIVTACERLLKQPAERRVFIMLADGEGSSREVLSKILQRYEARGVICVGVGIGQDMNEAFQYRARVDDSAQLGASGLAALLAAVAKDHAYHGGGDD